MKALTFELHLLEPLLATRLGGGDPNSAVGFEFIPGSMIRGMMISRYGRQNSNDATDATFRHLFLNDSVRFLNAYPQAYSKRALPTPLSWHKEKDTVRTAPVYDFAVKDLTYDRQQWQKVAEPFAYLWVREEDGIGKVDLLKPTFTVNIHTAREDRQRITKGESTVFRYEALGPGQTFCGVVLADYEGDLEILKRWLPEGEVVYLGGSHLAGYGQASLQNVQMQEDWCEYTPIGEDTDAIIVTLLSDTLIRDPLTGAYVATLEPVLGCAHEQAFIRVRVVGGFNRKWNLPLPQSLAIQAGSVFVYRAQYDLLRRLKDLEACGIGERRAEGFGRIAVNWHRTATIQPVERFGSQQPPFTLQDKDRQSIRLAHQMVERMLRQQLDGALIAAVNRLRIQDPPSNAQLSRMRVVVRQALSQGNPQIIIQHLAGMRKIARDQFQRARIGSDRLDEWLESRVRNIQSIWDVLGVDQRQSPTLGGIKPEWTSDLALEYTVRLIDRVLRKAQKEATNE